MEWYKGNFVFVKSDQCPKNQFKHINTPNDCLMKPKDNILYFDIIGIGKAGVKKRAEDLRKRLKEYDPCGLFEMLHIKTDGKIDPLCR